MENLLAIDIHDDCVSGVMLDIDQKISVVSGFGVAIAKEGGVAEAVQDVIRQTGFKDGACRLSVSAENCFFRNLLLPFVDKRKVAKVLPFEIEELTSHRIQDLHIDYLFSEIESKGTEVLAAMVDKGFVADTLATFQAEGLDPELFGVSGLQTAAVLASVTGLKRFVLLDISFKQTTLILINNGKIALVRSLGVDAEDIAGFSLADDGCTVDVKNPEKINEVVRRLVLPVKQTLLSVGHAALLEKGGPCFVNGGVGLDPELFGQLKEALPLDIQACDIARQPLVKIEPSESMPWNPAMMNRALALATYNRKGCAVLNFRKGDFKKQPSLKNIRKIVMATVVPLGVLSLGVFLFLFWEFNELENRRDTLKNEVFAVAQQAMPEAKIIRYPLKELTVKINETREVYRSGGKGGGNLGKLALLSELSSRIPENLPIVITRLVADQDDIRIKAETKDFNTVDNVKKELEKSEYFKSVTISSANLAPKGGEVRFELKLALQ
ncbi:PilN domain-containing protein [Desulfosediminicola flagellatus]|uniref:PilN domain-containing protein n=1 Tax=Desulfosediminicola flagellatus TaxID=2569541 RepID=UPI0010AD4665|nr:PilN domain-containing protein [Desulfosediminicola flagellatus]